MHKWAIIVILIFTGNSLVSQHLPIYQQFQVYEPMLNPAIAGSDFFSRLSLHANKQWANIAQGPQTFMLSTQLRLGQHDFYNPKMMLNKSKYEGGHRWGAGGLLIHDENGPLQSLCANWAFSYHLPIAYNQLSFGINTKYLRQQVNFSQFQLVDQNDDYLLDNDRVSTVDFDAGLYFLSGQFYAGASLLDVMGKTNSFYGGEAEMLSSFAFMAGYRAFLTYFDLEPFIKAAKLNKQDIFFEAGAKLYFYHFFYSEINYNTSKLAGFALGMSYHKFLFEYRFRNNLSPEIPTVLNHHTFSLSFLLSNYYPSRLRKVKDAR